MALRTMTTMLGAAAAFELPFKPPTRSEVAAPMIAAALAASLAAAPVFAADAGAGQSVFDGNCAACHAGGQNVIMPDKTLQQDVSRDHHHLRLIT
jgi:cytochrome c6